MIPGCGELLLVAIGSVCIGILSAFVGLGGGFLLVPMYTLVFGIAPEVAIGTSITATICTTLSASLFQIQSVKVHLPVIMRIVPFSIPTAIIGSYITQFLSGGSLTGIFGIFLGIMALKLTIWPVYVRYRFDMTRSFQGTEQKQKSRPESLTFRYLGLVGWIGGLVSGLTGISGGIIFVPALINRNIMIHDAVTISLAAIIFTSSGAAISNLLMGHVNILFLFSTAAGVISGAAIGVRISPYIAPEIIRWMLGISVGAISLVMIIRAMAFV
jgi:uncharacterized protein